MPDVIVDAASSGVTRIALNRPEQHNAFDRTLIDSLHQAIDQLDGSTRVLVLEGRGKSFCAGADVAWMRDSVALSPAENAADTMALSDLLQALDTFRGPTLARIQGAALGGGTGLAACCDIVIASEEASFGFSEVRLGLIPATISPYVLNAIGRREARRYFQTGERFDALEACRIGLVHEVCSPQELDDRVDSQIEALLKGGLSAQGAAKRLIAETIGRPTDETLRRELAERLATIRTGSEAQEGLSAFIEKRRPNW